MINQYTLIGQPVAHSISPAIHHLFGELTQRRVHYTLTEASDATFEKTVTEWFASGGKGCNITAPFKELAAKACHRLSENARYANAVNTIEIKHDGSLVGHNTDGIGLLADIEKNKRIPIAGKRVLILGAGGAARGAVAPLYRANPSYLHIANRTIERAKTMVEGFADLGSISYSSYDDLNNEPQFDIVINATSMGFDKAAPPLPSNIVNSDTFAYDMAYSKQKTPFLEWCEQNGVNQLSDGFGMLVEQAADAFLIWESVRPKTRKVYIASEDIINSAGRHGN